MSKGKRIVIVLIEIVVLAAAGFVVFTMHKIRQERLDQKLAAEEAVRLGTQNMTEEMQRAAADGLEAHKTAEEEKAAARLAEASEWNLILVNPWNRIPDDFSVETAEAERGYVIDARVRSDLMDMLSGCRDAGFFPQLISTFRTRETQQYLYDHTLNKADTAFPGTSEHECGLAADIIDADSAGWGDPLIEKQETMPAQKWLMEHCRDYGFILRYPKDKEEITGIIYEPWHYRYVGREHAAEIMESGLCLEEYLAQNYGIEHTTGSDEDRIR